MLISRILEMTAARVLACTILLWLSVFFVSRSLLWRDPHTAFFHEEGVYDLGYSVLRRAQGKQLITAITNGTAGKASVHAHNPLVCAAYTTFNREGRQYLQEAIGSMLHGLTDQERSVLEIRLLFTNVQPAKQSDWNATWLQVLDRWSGYEVPQDETHRIKGWEDARNFYVKGVYDYVYLLRQCLLDTAAPYIAMFEDDIIFADGWLHKTLHALAELRTNKRWLYLRLFYTEPSLGWDSSIDFWYRNMALTFLLAMSCSAAALLFVRRWCYQARKYLDPVTLAVLCFVAVPAFTALFFMLGKYTVRPLRGVEHMDHNGCCTQALVFPRNQVEGVVQYLAGRGHGMTDFMIEEYADQSGLERYALAPQVVQHVGMISSRDSPAINSRSTWAFYFEAQNQQRLAREKSRYDFPSIVTVLRKHETKNDMS